MRRAELDLRLIVITDVRLAQPRAVESVVYMALEAGAPAVQLRDKTATARDLFDQAVTLRDLTSAFGALLFINDRMDVALAARADGVHLGPDDMPLAAARRTAPASLLIGWSTDDPDQARTAEAQGADYIGCGAVFGTTSKDLADEQIGPVGLQRVVQAVSLPVVGIGGIDITNIAEVVRAGAAGAAVIRAVMAAPDVAGAVGALLRAFPH
jgi:thiamine-phosphate pyrophosphorylase